MRLNLKACTIGFSDMPSINDEAMEVPSFIERPKRPGNVPLRSDACNCKNETEGAVEIPGRWRCQEWVSSAG